MTDAVPWFVLLGILGVKAALNWRENLGFQSSSQIWQMQLVLGSLLVFVSIAINARGAISHSTMVWCAENIKGSDAEQRAKCWNWKYPQFLAGLISPPLAKAL